MKKIFPVEELQRLTAHDADRLARALEFQSVVEKLFSAGGSRSESEDSPVRLARRFRELAGFTDEEINRVVELSANALQEANDKTLEPRRNASAGAS